MLFLNYGFDLFLVFTPYLGRCLLVLFFVNNILTKFYCWNLL